MINYDFCFIRKLYEGGYKILPGINQYTFCDKREPGYFLWGFRHNRPLKSSLKNNYKHNKLVDYLGELII